MANASLRVDTMRELANDPFYETIEKYGRCVIEYFLMADDRPYCGLQSHKEAVLFAMLRSGERFVKTYLDDEARYGKVSKDPPRPWSHDMEKAKAVRIGAASFLSVPEILRRDRTGRAIYDCDCSWERGGGGGQIPYWYAFLEQPHRTGYKPEDFRRVNAALFPEGADALDVYEWTTDWSDYFDDGHEWWGAACWSVYDRRLDRYVVLFASATD